MYRLVYTSRAAKQIKKLNPHLKQEMKKRLELIANSPTSAKRKRVS